ncbi:MAG: hypothetical protein JW894_12950 [Bacteroidales bacterium]|nr:hypothetical protein [Bacteroidales bacterium]
MKKTKLFYKMYSKYGLEGYYVPVRNTMNNDIEREFIPLEAKDLFENQFGQNVITDKEFLSWYTENSVNFQ